MYVVLVAAILWLTLSQGLDAPRRCSSPCSTSRLRLGERDAPAAAVARYILIGAMLVGLMAARPQGLFGSQRVEIV